MGLFAVGSFMADFLAAAVPVVLAVTPAGTPVATAFVPTAFMPADLLATTPSDAAAGWSPVAASATMRLLVGNLPAGTLLTSAFLEGTSLAGAFLAGAFLAGAFLAGTFLAGTPLAVTFFAGASLAVTLLAATLLTATSFAGTLLLVTPSAVFFFAVFFLAVSSLPGALLGPSRRGPRSVRPPPPPSLWPALPVLFGQQEALPGLAGGGDAGNSGGHFFGRRLSLPGGRSRCCLPGWGGRNGRHPGLLCHHRFPRCCLLDRPRRRSAASTLPAAEASRPQLGLLTLLPAGPAAPREPSCLARPLAGACTASGHGDSLVANLAPMNIQRLSSRLSGYRPNGQSLVARLLSRVSWRRKPVCPRTPASRLCVTLPGPSTAAHRP